MLGLMLTPRTPGEEMKRGIRCGARDEAIKGLAAAQRARNGLLAVVAVLLAAVTGLLLWQVRSG